MTLRFGYLGIAAFLLAAASAIGQFVWIADKYHGESPQWLSSCVGGAMIGALAVLLTVWMPHEIGFILFWTYGISSGLVVASSYGKLGTPQKSRRQQNRDL